MIKYHFNVFLLCLVCLLSSTLLAEEPRHQGWNVHSALAWHPFKFDNDDDNDKNPPMGLASAGLITGVGYRGKGRWEGKLNLDVSVVQIKKSRFSTVKSPDTVMALSLEPRFHFSKNPPKWDPYLIVTSFGLMHLFRNSTSGFSIGFPGLGCQVHLNEKFSMYVEAKARGNFFGLGGPGGIALDALVPIGVVYRF